MKSDEMALRKKNCESKMEEKSGQKGGERLKF